MVIRFLAHLTLRLCLKGEGGGSSWEMGCSAVALNIPDTFRRTLAESKSAISPVRIIHLGCSNPDDTNTVIIGDDSDIVFTQ